VSSAEQVDAIVDLVERTGVREHMTLEQAVDVQFRLVDAAQRVMGSDEMFAEDVGQVRELATVGFGGGGRPRTTARVESVLRDFFQAEDAVLVQGAGTGGIRAMLNAGVDAGDSLVLHTAHAYKTTLPTMRHMGLDLHQVDFNDPEVLRTELRRIKPKGVYVQHVPQALGDVHEIDATIQLVRDELGDETRILVDDNYAVMRSRRIGIQMGADASAFSLFKLLAPEQVGVVAGRADVIGAIRRDLSSAGCQIQGPQAMAALRMLMYAPVSLAIQNQTVLETAARINDAVAAGELPLVRRAVAAQPGIRSIVLVFDQPIAEAFVRSAWRNGSPSQSVGEEAQYEVLPLFTYLTSTFLKSTEGLEKYAIRINPMRSGPDTILRILRAALDDEELRSAA
jgi:cystathionine beta-lyase family protein involved in aluminum resistance